MKKEFVTALLLLALGAPATVTTAAAQAAPAQKADQKPTFAGVLERTLKGTEDEVVPAAEAMPEDKYNFAPTQGEFKGVRTFAQQLKHIAAVNYMFGGAIAGEKPPVDIGSENGPDKMTSKADIVKFLKDSFDYLNKSLGTVNESNVLDMVQSPFGPNKISRLRLVLIATSHPFDHYGQIAVYLRMNGIIPPASRQ
jgi:uncharacterized damage-inducible protein DinB